MKVFTDLKAPPLLIRPLPLKKYKDVRALNEAVTAEFININKVHAMLESVHKEVKGSSMANRAHALKWHNAKTNRVALNITVGDYVIVRTDAHRNRKLQFKWCRAMLVKQAKFSLVFIVEDMMNAKTTNNVCTKADTIAHW